MKLKESIFLSHMLYFHYTSLYLYVEEDLLNEATEPIFLYYCTCSFLDVCQPDYFDIDTENDLNITYC